MLTNEHERIQDMFFSLLDGSLSEGDRLEVESHVATCCECAEELRVTRETSALVSALPQRELPDGFCNRFLARLAAETPAGADAPVPRVESSPTPVDSRPGLSVPDLEERIASDHRASLRRAADTNRLPASRTGFGRRLSLRMASALAACLAVVCGVALLWWVGRPAEPTLAVLEWTAGELTVQQGGEGSPRPVERARALRPGDILQTAAETRSLVRLGATGSIRLGARTRVAVVALGTSDDDTFMKLQVDHGAVWVEDTSDARCVVQTKGALIVPAGTVYDVRVDDGTTHVSVWEGQVDLQSTARSRGTGSSGRLQAGQRAEVSPATSAVRVGVVDVASRDTDAWVRWNRSIHAPAPVAPRAPLASPLTRSPSPPAWLNAPPPPPTWGSLPPATAAGSQGGPSPRPSTGRTLPMEATPPAVVPPLAGAKRAPVANPVVVPRAIPTRPLPPGAVAAPHPPRAMQGHPQVDSGAAARMPGVGAPQAVGAPRMRTPASGGATSHAPAAGHPGAGQPHVPPHSPARPPGVQARRPQAPQGPRVIDTTYPTAPSRLPSHQAPPPGTPQVPAQGPTQATPTAGSPGHAGPGAHQPGQGSPTGPQGTQPRTRYEWPRQRRYDPSQQQKGPQHPHRQHDWSRPQRQYDRSQQPRQRNGSQPQRQPDRSQPQRQREWPRVRSQGRPSSSGWGGQGAASATRPRSPASNGTRPRRTR